MLRLIVLTSLHLSVASTFFFLSNFLKRLSSSPYNILEQFERDGVPRYKLTDYGKIEAKRWQLIQLVKDLDDSILEDVYQWILKFIEKKMYESIKVVKRRSNALGQVSGAGSEPATS